MQLYNGNKLQIVPQTNHLFTKWFHQKFSHVNNQASGSRMQITVSVFIVRFHCTDGNKTSNYHSLSLYIRTLFLTLSYSVFLSVSLSVWVPSRLNLLLCEINFSSCTSQWDHEATVTVFTPSVTWCVLFMYFTFIVHTHFFINFNYIL